MIPSYHTQDGEDVRVENIGMDYAIPGTDGGPNFVEVKMVKRFIITIRL